MEEKDTQLNSERKLEDVKGKLVEMDLKMLQSDGEGLFASYLEQPRSVFTRVK